MGLVNRPNIYISELNQEESMTQESDQLAAQSQQIAELTSQVKALTQDLDKSLFSYIPILKDNFFKKRG